MSKIKRPWAMLALTVIGLITIGGLSFQTYYVMSAIQAGQPPVEAFHSSQGMLWRFLKNPLVFGAYLLALVTLLWNEISMARREPRVPFNSWVIAAILIAILTLTYRFVR